MAQMQSFLIGKDVYILLPTRFIKFSLGLTPTAILMVLPTGSTGCEKSDLSAQNVIDGGFVQSASNQLFFKSASPLQMFSIDSFSD